MAEFKPLWPEGPLFAQAKHFRLGTDAVLLADFVRTAGMRRGMDLGCASGAIALLLLARTERLHMSGLEILPEAAELARENMNLNGWADRADISCGDLRCCREHYASGSFDFVVSNPPYYALSSGAISDSAGRASARSEVNCTLEELCAAAAYLCRTGGRVSFSGKPERLSEVLCTMSAHGIEPKRLRLVCARPGRSPSLFLVEGLRGGAVGLVIEPDLILADNDGNDTAEYRRIYHR